MSKKGKYVLDTSILFENISQDGGTVISKLDRNKIKRRFHLYHCLIEFRLGLLCSWIGFYLEVLATQDIKGAKRKLARIINFKPRQGSTYVLLEALLAELFTSLETGNVEQYLTQLEECINYAQTSLELLSCKMVGSNSNHHLLQPNFLHKEDYEDFLRRCKSDYVVDLANTFTSKNEKLKELLSYLKSLQLKGEEAKRAQKIIGLVEQALGQPLKVNSKQQNRLYGDIVIAVDTPKGFQILSSDGSFGLLCGGLGKEFVEYGSLS